MMRNSRRKVPGGIPFLALSMLLAALAAASWAAKGGANPGGKTGGKPVPARPDRVEIRGDRVEYSGKEGRVTFMGKVVVTRETATLRADELTTLRGANEAAAKGNVTLTDPVRKVDLTCQEIVYTQGLHQVIASGNCHLIVGEGEGLTVVDSDEMEVFVNRREAIARGNVRIRQGENGATCGLAHLYGNENRVALFGDPVITRPPHEFRSEEVISYFQEGRIILSGNVRAKIHAGNVGDLKSEGIGR